MSVRENCRLCVRDCVHNVVLINIDLRERTRESQPEKGERLMSAIRGIG